MGIFFIQSMKVENVPLRDLFNNSNCKYRINRTINLLGQQVNVPENCTLFFSKDGKIINGTLVGHNTSIECKKSCIGANLLGTWNVTEIRDEWFDSSYLTDDDILSNINNLQVDTIQQDIIISNKKEYNCSIKDGTILRLSSNTSFFLNSKIKLNVTDKEKYSILSVRDKCNVTIKGGTIVGDVEKHKGTTGEWGMGISVSNSRNVTIEDIVISSCWGDGIYIGGRAENAVGDYDFASKDIVLNNIVCDGNRRQGMSITHVDGLIAKNCFFINTGQTKFTRPGAGVDIEPNIKNKKNQSCRNIGFNNCVFKGNVGPAFFQYNSCEVGGINNLGNISAKNCSFSGLVSICAPNNSFISCELEDLVFNVNSSPVSAVFFHCNINAHGLQARTKKTKRDYKGVIVVFMRDCKITLYDAENLVHLGQWNSSDSLNLINCKILIPERLNSEELLFSNSLKRILKYSNVEYIK